MSLMWQESLLDPGASPRQKDNKSSQTLTRVWPFCSPSLRRSTNIVSISLPSQATSLFLWPSNWQRKMIGIYWNEYRQRDRQCVCGYSCTSSINLAWPCWSIGRMAFCSKPTEPGYSILLPNEWAMRKLEGIKQKCWNFALCRKIETITKPQIELNTSIYSLIVILIRNLSPRACYFFFVSRRINSLYLMMWHGRVRTELKKLSAAPLNLGSGFSSETPALDSFLPHTVQSLQSNRCATKHLTFRAPHTTWNACIYNEQTLLGMWLL